MTLLSPEKHRSAGTLPTLHAYDQQKYRTERPFLQGGWPAASRSNITERSRESFAAGPQNVHPMTALETVEQFRLAWDTGDVERVCALVTDDIFYHNLPRAPMTGRDTFRAYIDDYEQRFGKILSVKWDIRNIAGNGDVVFLERVSHLTFAGGRRIDCPIVGVFEVRDGKIASWRDYFDKNSFDG